MGWTEGKTTGILFCPLLKIELVNTALWTLLPEEQDAHLWRTFYRGAGGSKGVGRAQEWAPKLHRAQVQMTTNCSSRKNSNLMWQTCFFQSTGLQGLSGIQMSPYTSLSCHANRLTLPCGLQGWSEGGEKLPGGLLLPLLTHVMRD